MRIFRPVSLLVLLFALASLSSPASASGKVDCEMRFNLSGWSAFYKSATGTATITCNNGQSMQVKLRAKGGGITFGKSTIENGKGEFSGAHNINELLGTYVSADAHAGATKSAGVQVVTKGEISLALAGTGRGWDVGVAFGKFVISKR